MKPGRPSATPRPGSPLAVMPAKALAEAAGRAQEVVKKLPKEKELADAARIFANRSTAAAAELAALEKASVEKAAALKKAVEELIAAAKAVEAVRAKAPAGPRVGSTEREDRPGPPPEDGREPGRRGRTPAAPPVARGVCPFKSLRSKSRRPSGPSSPVATALVAAKTRSADHAIGLATPPG